MKENINELLNIMAKIKALDILGLKFDFFLPNIYYYPFIVYLNKPKRSV